SRRFPTAVVVGSGIGLRWGRRLAEVDGADVRARCRGRRWRGPAGGDDGPAAIRAEGGLVLGAEELGGAVDGLGLLGRVEVRNGADAARQGGATIGSEHV